MYSMQSRMNSMYAIGSKFLEKKNITLLSDLIKAIDQHNQLIDKAKSIAGLLQFHSIEQIQKLLQLTQNLLELGYGHLMPVDLKMVIEMLTAITQHFIELKTLAMTECSCLPEPPKNLSDALRLMHIADVLEKSPLDIIMNGHPENVLEIAPNLCNSARLECTALQNELSILRNFFDMSVLPKYDELSEITGVLKKYHNSLFAFFNKDYRIARKLVKDFLTDKKHLKTKDLVNHLEKMVNVSKQLDNVHAHKNYKRILGPLYKGIDTDWEHLNSVISWCQSFREAVGSQKHAMTLLPNILDIKENTLKTAKKVKESWNKLSGELEKINTSIQSGVDFEVQLDVFNKLQVKIENAARQFFQFKELENVTFDLLNECFYSLVLANNIEDATNNNKDYQETFDNFFNGVRTEVVSIKLMADWVTSLQNQSKLPIEYIRFVVQAASNSEAQLLTQLVAESKKFLKYYRSFFSTELSSVGTLIKDEFSEDKELGLSSVRDRFVECLSTIQYLVKMSDYFNAIERTKSIGIELMAEQIDKRMIGSNECESFYRSIFYDSMAREIIKKYPELKQFTRTNYENIIQRFSELDRKIMKRTTERIAYNLSKKNIPRGIGWGLKADYTELHLINHEINKKKRYIPIRQLVKRAGNALQALKPCFMMSPLSVAQYLVPGKINFDIVVMDEASQIRPADALGAIARTNQIVIVGDPNQLPPTSFFERIGVEDYEEEATAVTDAESILDICLSSYKKRRLRWHYRSEHESLIAFSNSKFYEGDLIVFPSPYGKNNSYGIRYHYIEEAKYYKGRNRKEAEVIANAIAEHINNHPKESLGVATFNKEQSDLIMDILESMQKKQPLFEKTLKTSEQSNEPFFVKNLENVQGDERDVIFISTTYGPDQETGHVFQRFGPITGETGWRRLNVIVTRAKKRVEIFTSMKSTDIKLTPSSKRGVEALKAYLEYAEKGILADRGEIPTGKEPDSDFEIAVSRMLKSHSYEVVPQVGVAGFFIDIGVKHPFNSGEYILGIECDGKSYHSAKSIRDRDRLRQDILETKGWKIHRIWSTDWFKNRESESQRLLNILDELIKKERQSIEISERKKTTTPPKRDVQDKQKGEVQELEFWGHGPGVERKKMILREELELYNKKNILPSFPDTTGGILRDEMLDYFIKGMPITKEDFFLAIPLSLREKTNSKQLKFLDDIFEIIENYIFS